MAFQKVLFLTLVGFFLSLPFAWPGRAAVETVAMTAETGGGFARLRFDWAEPVGFDAKIGGRRLVIRFDRPFTTSLRGARAILSDFVATATLEPDLRTLALSLRRDLEMRETVVGTSVYFDLWLPGATPPAPPDGVEALASAENEPAERPAPPSKLASFDPFLGKPPAPAGDATAGKEDADAEEGKPVDLLVKEEEPPFMTAERVENGADLRFAWAESVAAAVFRRGPYVWLVFDRHAEAELEAARAALGDIVASIDEVPAGQGLALRFALPEWLNPDIQREERNWVVTIRRRALRPSRPLTVERRDEADGATAVVLPFDGAGDVVSFVDPEVGDTVVVVPVIPARLGLAEAQAFAQFALLRTGQGIVVLPHADALAVERRRWGVRIAAPGGLAVSVAETMANETASDAGDSIGTRVFDFEAWAGGGADRFLDRKRELFAAISLASPDTLSSRRLDLARFYFAHGLHAEANGVFRRLAEEDPELADRPANRILTGAIRQLAGDLDGARDILLPRTFDGNADAAPWRGLARLAAGETDKAATEFARGAGALATYPAGFRVPLVLAAIDNALDGKELDQAESYLALLDGPGLSPEQAGSRAVLKGRLFAAQGAADRAHEEWEAAIRQTGTRAAVRARFERTLADLKRNRIESDRAIMDLEELRFDWRGGDVEFRALEALGGLYAAEGRYLEALERLRAAATHFPGHPGALGVTERMGEVFTALFLDGAAAGMAPITALALFNEYRELTPSGAEGERMVLALAERLMAADLLNQASTLLDHQVRYRLAGEERAYAGTLLAETHLAQGRPEDALIALRASVASGLGRLLTDRRTRLQARALLDVGDMVRSRALLVGDHSEEAEILRAEISWRATDWPAAAAAYGHLISGTTKAKPLPPGVAFNILRRAVALAMAGQDQPLRTVVADWGEAMAESSYANAFAAVVEGIGPDEGDYRSLAENLGAVAALRRAIAAPGAGEAVAALKQ